MNPNFQNPPNSPIPQIIRRKLHDLFNSPIEQHPMESLNESLKVIFQVTSTEELFSIMLDSRLYSQLKTLEELTLSGVIFEEGLESTILKIFANFLSTEQGKDSLFTIFAFLHLLSKPCSELSDAQTRRLEELKTLMRFVLSDDFIVQMMHLRDLAQSRPVVPCNCQNCKEIQDNLTFGWYFLALKAHSRGMFQRCEG